MTDCIFCKIAKAEIPCYKIYEDKDFLAFLDIRPLTKGNSLVIPKKHYRWVDDVPDFGKYFEVAKKIGLVCKKVFDAKWVNYITIGLEVPHAHIRVVPRYKSDLHGPLPDIEKYEKYTQEEMKQIAQSIKKEIKGGGR